MRILYFIFLKVSDGSEWDSVMTSLGSELGSLTFWINADSYETCPNGQRQCGKEDEAEEGNGFEVKDILYCIL